MGIQNFPVALQPIIQQGFLEREFEQALVSRLGDRACADREDIAVGIGETLTKTRAGLKPTGTAAIVAATNKNFDNGLTPGNWGVEQYTITINHYAATMDLNMVTSRVGIASQFLQNAYTNGEQAARSLDELARNALYSAYFGGNTRVRVTLGSAGAAVSYQRPEKPTPGRCVSALKTRHFSRSRGVNDKGRWYQSTIYAVFNSYLSMVFSK